MICSVRLKSIKKLGLGGDGEYLNVWGTKRSRKSVKGCLFLSLHIYLERHTYTLTTGGMGGGALDGRKGKVPGINNRSPQSLDKSKARRSQLLLLRRMRPPRMLFGVRASRVGSYVQQAQTAKRFAKDKVSRGFLHPSIRLPPQRPQDPRAIGSAIPRHAGSPPPIPSKSRSENPGPRQGEAAVAVGSRRRPLRSRRGRGPRERVGARRVRGPAPRGGSDAGHGRCVKRKLSPLSAK